MLTRPLLIATMAAGISVAAFSTPAAADPHSAGQRLDHRDGCDGHDRPSPSPHARRDGLGLGPGRGVRGLREVPQILGSRSPLRRPRRPYDERALPRPARCYRNGPSGLDPRQAHARPDSARRRSGAGCGRVDPERNRDAVVAAPCSVGRNVASRPRRGGLLAPGVRLTLWQGGLRGPECH